MLLIGFIMMIAVGYWLRKLQREEDTNPEEYYRKLEERMWGKQDKE